MRWALVSVIVIKRPGHWSKERLNRREMYEKIAFLVLEGRVIMERPLYPKKQHTLFLELFAYIRETLKHGIG